MNNCGTTHYEGCECHEALWRQRLDSERNEILKLREELKLSEARRAELLLEIQDFLEYTPKSFKNCTAENYETNKADLQKIFASQSRPKILDVLEAARDIGHSEYCDMQMGRETCNCALGKALAAMERE